MPLPLDTQNRLQRPVFCALQELDIGSESLALLDTFFEMFSIAPKAISLNITDVTDSTLALPASIFRLSNACACSSLEKLLLSITDRSAGDDTSVSAATFRSPFAFHNLRKLDIEVNYVVPLDDAVLLQMATAWPLMEELHINEHYCHTSHHDVTPNAFVSLLQHCPHLISVGITINWSTVDGRDISPGIPYQGFTHKALSGAYFGSSMIRHPTRIAAFISAITPNVDEVVAWDYESHQLHPGYKKYFARWKLVQRLVGSFSMVRKQERKTMLNVGEGVVQPAQVTANGEVTVGSNIGGGGEVFDGDVSESEDEDSDHASSDIEEEE